MHCQVKTYWDQKKETELQKVSFKVFFSTCKHALTSKASENSAIESANKRIFSLRLPIIVPSNVYTKKWFNMC